MDVKEQIKTYIDSQPEQKANDMQALHRRILQVMPAGNYGSWMAKTVKAKLFPIQI